MCLTARDWIDIALALVVAAGTIALAVTAYRGLKKNNEILQETFRPYVTLSLICKKVQDKSPYVLAVSNTGERTAIDIRFEVLSNEQKVQWKDICSVLGFGPNPNEALEKGLSSLQPQETMYFAFRGDSEHVYGGDEFIQDLPNPTQIRVTYTTTYKDFEYSDVSLIRPEDKDLITLENIHTVEKKKSE